MKKLLSILLSVMLILGTVSITALADTPTLALVTSGSLAPLNGVNVSALAGKYVLFDAVADAEYKNNGSAADVIEAPFGDSTKVALKLNAGVNVFTAEVGGVSSNAVNVYGFELERLGGKDFPPNFRAGDTATVKGYITAYENALAAGTVTEDIQANYDFAKKLFDYDEDTKTYGYVDFATNNTGVGQFPSANTSPDNHSSGSLTGTFLAHNKGYALINFDVFVNGSTTKDNVALFRHYFENSSTYTKYLYLDQDGTLSLGSTDIAYKLTPNEWHNIAYAIDVINDGHDFYLDNILVAKDFEGIGTDFTKLRLYVETGDANVYVKNPDRDWMYYSEVPAITAVVDDTEDTITVTGMNRKGTATAPAADDLEQFSNYDIKVFVDGEATDDNVLLGAPTYITVDEDKASAQVYAAVVDADGNVINALTPLKTAEFTMSLNAPEAPPEGGEDPTKLTLSLVSDVVWAKEGSKVRFVEPTTVEGYSIKYYNNNEEVAPTAISAGIIGLPVSDGTNSYVAKVYARGGQIAEGCDSDPVEVVGKALNDEPSSVHGYTKWTALRTNTVTNADISDASHATLYNVNAHAYQLNAGTAFSTKGLNYISYKYDVCYTLDASGNIDPTYDFVKLCGFSTSSGGSAVVLTPVIYKNGDLKLDTSSNSNAVSANAIDTGVDLSPNTWYNIEMVVNNDTKGYDLYINGALVVSDYIGSLDFTNGALMYAMKASTSVYYSNFSYAFGYMPKEFDGKVTANIATGEVTVSIEALEGLDASSEVAVFGRKADGTVTVSKFTFGDAETTKTVNLGTGHVKFFVWTWDDLVPLCSVIE